MASYEWPPIIGVGSINGLVGAVTLVAGSNITITPSGQNLIIAASGGGGGSGFDTIGTFDTGVATTDGLNASGTTLFAQSADATHPGMVNIGAQTFAGDKTFTGHIVNSALTASRAMVTSGGSILTTAATTATEIGYVNGVTSAIQTQLNSKQATLTIGDLTDAGTDGIIVTGGVGSIIGSGVSLAQHVADASHNGYLSSADWSTFNGKQASGNYITALTGDVTAAGPGSSAATLATVNSNVGSFASVTVNAKGLVTAAAALTGDITSSGAATTLATVNSNVGSFGSSTSIPSFTVNAKGLLTAASGNVVIAPAGTLTGTTLASNVVTSSLTSVGTITSGTWTGTTIALANGGTGQTTKAPAFDALSPMTTGGDLIYGGTSGTGTRLANGTAGQFLKSSGTTVAPTWAFASTLANVNARYYSSSTSMSASLVTIVWTTKDYDSNNAMASGIYTCPVAGKYEVSFGLQTSGTAALSTQVASICQNGIEQSRFESTDIAGVANVNLQGTGVANCALNDTLSLKVIDGRTGAAITSSTILNFITITLIGT